MAQRILGMGDIVSLVEKAQEQFDEKEAKRLENKIKKNKFDFDDFKTQLNYIRKMGNLKSLVSMIPGMGKMAKNMDIDDNAFNKIEAIINSMTPHERKNPAILNGSRKKRIARGSGNKLEEVNQFMRQFDQMRKMMHQMSKMQGKGGGMNMPNFPR
jgi:signal recognition particle subunit SRP54